MKHAPSSAHAHDAPITPAQLGVGARLSLAVMRDDYAEAILAALAQADSTGLHVQTGDISTFVGGPEPDVLRYLTDVIAAAGHSGAHVSAGVLLSRGCPGEVTCTLSPDSTLPHVDLPTPEPVGLPAVAEWALYPLDDGTTGTTDHMRDIEAAIDYARTAGTYVSSLHYVPRLEGDLANVLHTVAAGWTLVGRRVPHVTTHATVSLHSPSTR